MNSQSAECKSSQPTIILGSGGAIFKSFSESLRAVVRAVVLADEVPACGAVRHLV